MRICFVTSTLISGGSERVMTLLANRLSNRGHYVEIVHLNQHVVFYPVDDRVDMAFAEDEVGTSLWKKKKWLRNHVKNTRPDVIVPFMEAVYCFTLFSLIGCHIPIVSSERIDPRKSPLLRNILRRVFLPLTDWLVVQTYDIKHFYPQFIQDKTSVIYNPVSERVFHLEKVPKENVIISVGKLDDQKNHEMLIRSFSHMADDFSGWNLVIYGEGPRRQSLQLLIDNLQLTNRVKLPGRCERVIDKMNQAKIFAFASNYEGMSNAILEAVCVGLPIVTTNVSGATELVKNGEGGFIIPVGNEVQMTACLRKLLQNVDLRESMGNLNRTRKIVFELDGIVDQWESLFYKIISKDGNVAKTL